MGQGNGNVTCYGDVTDVTVAGDVGNVFMSIGQRKRPMQAV